MQRDATATGILPSMDHLALRPDPVTRLVRARVADLAPRGVPVVRDAVRGALTRALRGDRPSPAHDGEVADPGDPGLTGPGSASWQVMADVAGLPAGNRALLMQALHPLAVAGVVDHSTYREDPFGRLHRTGAWVATTTFGSTRQAVAVSRLVRRMHERVVGTTPDGRPYAASSPALLAWVSMTFTDSLLACDRAFGAHPADDAAADRFVLEQSRIGALLDPRVDLSPFTTDDPGALAALRAWDLELPLLSEGLLPADVDGLRRCLARYDDVLEVDAQGREVLSFLDRPGLPTSAMPAYRALQLGAMATLPLLHRRLLGRPWLRGPAARIARRQAGGLMTGMRLGTGDSPARAAARRRVAAG